MTCRPSTPAPSLSLAVAAALFAVLPLVLTGCGGPRTAFEPGELTRLVDTRGVALRGYDPVSYFDDDGPRRGVPEYEATHEGAVYRFVSETHRDAFLAEPERYAPAFGGWCAWAVADGEGALVEVDPKSFLIQDGRLLLFYDGILADTRKCWLEQDAAALLQQADAHWVRLSASAESASEVR